MSNNSCKLLGHVGADAELRYTQSGIPVASFRLATNKQWTDKNGNKQENTQWHRVVMFGKIAETTAPSIMKGCPLQVEGEIQYRSFTDKDGVTRYVTEIKASSILTYLVRNNQQRTESAELSQEEPSSEPAEVNF
jgi:single-strand DNA-binding protein